MFIVLDLTSSNDIKLSAVLDFLITRSSMYFGKANNL